MRGQSGAERRLAVSFRNFRLEVEWCFIGFTRFDRRTSRTARTTRTARTKRQAETASLSPLRSLRSLKSFVSQFVPCSTTDRLEIFQAALRLFHGTAFNGEDNITRQLATDLDDFLPVDDAVAAGAADGRAGDLAAFGCPNARRICLWRGGGPADPSRDSSHAYGSCRRKVTVAGVEVDADRGLVDEPDRCGPDRRASCCIAGAARGRLECRAVRRLGPPL